MNLYTISTKQLIIFTVLGTILFSAISGINIYLNEYFLLPEVRTTEDGKCEQVINFANGDAYTCDDVDVLLRRYRKPLNEQISEISVRYLSQDN